jgi:hypothetical protein
MNHLVIDSEFLSLRFDAKILSIGTAVLDDKARNMESCILARGYWMIDLDSMPEGVVDHKTLHWWLMQDKSASKALLTPGEPVGLVEVNFFPEQHVRIEEALQGLTEMYHEMCCKRVWSHGAACDIALLKHWYDLKGMKEPWDYRAIRDTRTLYEAFEYEKMPVHSFKGLIPHRADHDAEAEAKNIFQALEFKK